MPANWSKKMRVVGLHCNACGLSKPEGHLNEGMFLCEPCYIDKFIPMKNLKPMPHRSLRTPDYPDFSQKLDRAVLVLKRLFLQLKKWFHQKWNLFHLVG